MIYWKQKPQEGGRGNFEVILVQMFGPEFQNQPYSYNIYILIKTEGYSNIEVAELNRRLLGLHIRTFPYIGIYPPPRKNKAQEMQIYQVWLLTIHDTPGITIFVLVHAN